MLVSFSCVFIFVNCIVIAQRKTGETALNEASSRSHQILRLVCLSFTKAALSSTPPWLYYECHFLCSFHLCIYVQKWWIPKTIESSARDYGGSDKQRSLAATVVWKYYSFSDMDNLLGSPRVIFLGRKKRTWFSVAEFSWSCWEWAIFSGIISWYKIERR